MQLYYFSKQVFGARFYDSELGMWISPDPARQYNSPYAFGYAPNMGVDADGRWFGVDDIIVGAVGAVGGGVAACMNGHCDVTDGKFWAYVGAGTAIAYASYYTGGAAAGAMGGGFAATAGGAAVGGSVAASANYTSSYGIESYGNGFYDDFGSKENLQNLGLATLKGGISGAVGGGIGYYGDGAQGAFWSGFGSGATGTALNGGNAYEIAGGGLVGGVASWGVYEAQLSFKSDHRTGYEELDNKGTRRELSEAYRKSRRNSREEGGYLTRKGPSERWASGSPCSSTKCAISPSSNPALDDVASFHTHPLDAKIHPSQSPADMNVVDARVNAKVDYVVGPKNIYRYQSGGSPGILGGGTNHYLQIETSVPF